MDYTVPGHFYEFQYGWYRDIDLDYEAEQLLKVLDAAQKENDIQHYIKENKKWFIPASIFKDYDFGHHEAYISIEQPLGAEYRADYMLLGRNSIGYHIVLVEFENVNVDFRLQKSNMETETVRKGMAQIDDWKRWMDSNRLYFLWVIRYRKKYSKLGNYLLFSSGPQEEDGSYFKPNAGTNSI